MSDKDPKERKDYMKESKDSMQRPPVEKEGLEEPRVSGLPKVKVGIVIFVVLVLIIVILGVSFDMFGLFSN